MHEVVFGDELRLPCFFSMDAGGVLHTVGADAHEEKGKRSRAVSGRTETAREGRERGGGQTRGREAL